MRHGLRHKQDIHAMQRKRTMRKIKFAFAGVVVFVGAISFLIWGPLFAVKSVTVSGAEGTTSAAIAQLAKVTIANAGGLFPADLFFALPNASIAQAIKAQYPQIESVDLNTPDTHTLAITLHDRLASFLWCGETIDVADKHCSYLSSDGLLLGAAPVFSGDHYVEFYGALAHDGSARRFTTVGDFAQIRQLVAELLTRSYDVDRVLLVDDQTLSLYLKSGWFIKVSISGEDSVQDAAQLSDRLEIALANADVQSKITAGELEYIDLRFSNKIFFK